MKTTLITTSLALLFLSGTIAVGKHAGMAKNLFHEKTSHVPLAASPKVLEFDFAKGSIREGYIPNLNRIAVEAIKNNTLVSLSGHADSIGAYKANWVLSDKRAMVVKDYLVSKGVKEERIVTTPYGDTVPIASNKTAEGRQKNRRVEISIKTASK